MRIVFPGLCFALIAVAIDPTRAALVATDGFESYAAGSQLESGADGSPGTGLSGGSGFTGAYETDDLNKSHAVIAAQGLSYNAGSVQINGGANAASITGAITISTDFLARSFPAQSDTLYLSFLLRGTQTSPDEDFLQIGFSGSATGEPPIAAGIAGAVANTLPDQFFIRMPALTANQTLLPSPTFALDTTYLMVVKVSKVGSGNFNQLDFFLNPTTLTEPGAATLTRFADSGVPTATNFRMRVARLDVGDSYLVDEVKIGTAYADVVVPEPSLAMAGASGALVFSLFSRRRQGQQERL